MIFSDINAYQGELGDNALFAHADTSKSSEVDALVDLAVEKFGTLDIMINNAGIGTLNELTALSDEEWEHVIAVNEDGVFYGVRAAARYMKESNVAGSIINMASILGTVGFRGAVAYCASKGAVNQITRTAALELAPANIRVNSIAPGFIKTEMTKDIQEDEGANNLVVGATPLGHMGEPKDIAYAATYLASDEAKFVTGSVLYVDGGWMAQ